jgi:hypothetical protein
MTLEEAIKHAEEVAATSCDGCREEHEQLAAWLKELKEIKESSVILPNNGNPWGIAQLIINAKCKVRNTCYIASYRTMTINTFNKSEIKALGKHLLNYAETEEELEQAEKL